MKGKYHPTGKKKKGAALFLVILVISTLSIFGGVLFILTNDNMMLTQLEIDKLKALALAEAGISMSINELKTTKDKHGDGLGNISKMKLGEGYFQVKHNFQNLEIISTGVVNGVKRTLQIKYALN